MRILVTGFEPFGGRTRNPSQEVALALNGAELGGVTVIARILPVDTLLAPQVLDEAIREVQPQAVVLLGEAASRTRISIERVAVNLRDFRAPDNSGYHIIDQPIDAHGPDAIFATLPVRALHTALVAEDVPIELSLSAGAYLCNQVMYHALQTLDGSAIPTGFIHLPRSFTDPHAELEVDLPRIEAGVRRLVEHLALQLTLSVAPVESLVG